VFRLLCAVVLGLRFATSPPWLSASHVCMSSLGESLRRAARGTSWTSWTKWRKSR
jgi:hypothetical protein